MPGAYERDRLRPLRLARLATEIGFEPDEETGGHARGGAAGAGGVARARFRRVKRLVVADRVVEGIALADRVGLLDAVLPEMRELKGVEQSRYHHLDVYDHTIEVLAQQVAIEREPAKVFGDELGAAVDAQLSGALADELTPGRRCAWSRSSTTSQSPRPAASSPTGGSRSWATTRWASR